MKGRASMVNHCPGSKKLRTPEISVRQCPGCGGDVELFSDETHAHCERCGMIVHGAWRHCTEWCKFADLCRAGAKNEKYNAI